MRGVVISNAVAGRQGVEVFSEHQPPRFLEAQLLLKLQRRPGDGSSESGDGSSELYEVSQLKAAQAHVTGVRPSELRT
jgi:hypothetical protein